MPISSYLIFPHGGQEANVRELIESMDQCSLIPSDKEDVFVLVTETASDEEDELVLSRIQSADCVYHISFISGFSTKTYEKT